MILLLFSGAWGKMIHEKNLKQKILWHCPFKLKELGSCEFFPYYEPCPVNLQHAQTDITASSNGRFLIKYVL